MSRYPGLEIVLQEEKKDMSDKNTLYLECRSGISGDMTVAALLDLGATEENLRRTLAKLPVGGYEIKVQRLIKNGLEVCDFDVILEEEAEHSHEHVHDTEAHEDHHSHEHIHGDNQEHHHSHGGHAHAHIHRTWKDIEEILEAADLKPRVLELSRQMFRSVAEAEGKAHGCPPEKVHFHEVGAVDSIVDIVGTAACLEELGVEKVLVSDLWEGSGHVRCQHGVLPVPVPAVLEMGVTPVEVKESVYQATAYLGIGRVFPFLKATNEIFAARGISLPLEGQPTTTTENRLEGGEQAQTSSSARRRRCCS